MDRILIINDELAVGLQPEPAVAQAFENIRADFDKSRQRSLV